MSHSQGHTSYDPTQNPQRYWDFSFVEIGQSDIPAMITGIKKTLANSHYYDKLYYNIEKVIYVGYDQGANAMLYSLAKQEQSLKNDVSAVVLIAPCAKMNIE